MPNECRELSGLVFKCYLFSIMIFFLSLSLGFVRVNLASVSVHYHLLTVHCQLRSSGLSVDFLLFFCGLIISPSGLNHLIKSPKI